MISMSDLSLVCKKQFISRQLFVRDNGQIRYVTNVLIEISFILEPLSKSLIYSANQ